MVQKAGFALWLTGLPSSGKTTLARVVAGVLREQDVGVQVLDSDHLREVLTPEPTYSSEERDWFYQVMVYVGQLLTGNGVNVIFAATAHRRCYRERARETMERFEEIYVECSLETCMSRDRKGIYQKALAGQAKSVPGLQVIYEPPQTPLLVVDTERYSAEECVRQIVDRLKAFSFLGKESKLPPAVLEFGTEGRNQMLASASKRSE
jgi:adenylylsulfate kinase